MNVLGIETATLVCGAALVRDGQLLADSWVEERSVHAERLFGLVDEVLARSGCAPRELDAIAVSIGPGSFTGLRIGLSAAKGLHLALGIPIVEVPTLTALARKCVPPGGSWRGHVVVALDARRDEVYCQLFNVQDGRAEPIDVVRARAVRDVAADLPEGEILLTGDAREKVATAITARRPAVRNTVTVADSSTARCSAGEIAKAGEELCRRQEYADPGELEPRYVKDVFLGPPH
jgi:tRNA threonylcarbamoyladenosine biosynthesis protein TsaB